MIERKQVVVYYAPTKGKRYLTKSAAIKAEARAIIKKHIPDEKSSGWYGGGSSMNYDPGWSLEVDEPERFKRYFEKLKRALRNRLND
jgi:hypothetical protein